jgi:DNA-binding transcriptional regulator LsrR (DeoR family)
MLAGNALTCKEICDKLGLSESTVRELLEQAVQDDTLEMRSHPREGVYYIYKEKMN